MHPLLESVILVVLSFHLLHVIMYITTCNQITHAEKEKFAFLYSNIAHRHYRHSNVENFRKKRSSYSLWTTSFPAPNAQDADTSSLGRTLLTSSRRRLLPRT